MINRIIDANLNRLKEGLRVVEDFVRYVSQNEDYSKQLKALRHKCIVPKYEEYLKDRNILNDPAKTSSSTEESRENINSIVIANFKRAQESSRVLEESFKLIDIKLSSNFKEIRYELYDLEKRILLND